MCHNEFSEKRQFQRFPVSIRAAFQEPDFCGHFRQAQTKDISVSGVGLLTDKKLIPGTELEICLYMDDGSEEVKFKGRAVWAIQVDYQTYRVGVKLHDSSLRPIPLVLRILKLHQS